MNISSVDRLDKDHVKETDGTIVKDVPRLFDIRANILIRTISSDSLKNEDNYINECQQNDLDTLICSPTQSFLEIYTNGRYANRTSFEANITNSRNDL